MRILQPLLLLATGAAAFAQNETITLHGWRAKAGDNAAWAQAEFDDSDWVKSRRPERQGAITRTSKVTWFRADVTIPPMWAGQRLALALGPTKDAYEVFVNGALVGRFGSMPPTDAGSRDDADVVVYPERIRSFVLPQSATSGQKIVVAVRLWSLRALHRNPANNRLMASGGTEDPVIGLAETITRGEELETVRNWLTRVPTFLLWLLVLGCGLFCLWLYQSDRNEVELLWVGLAFVSNGVAQYTGLVLMAELIPKNSQFASLMSFVPFVGVHFFYCLLLGELLPEAKLVIRRAALPIAFASLATLAFSFWRIPVQYETLQWLTAAGTLIQTALGLLAAGRGMWSHRADQAMLGIGVSARSFTTFLSAGVGGGGGSNIRIGDLIVQVTSLGNVAVALMMVGILYHRFRKRTSARREAERDLEAARRVQEALLGADHREHPGFEVEIAYRPAKQVGGDFYYFSPSVADGSLLIVVGDVSGKGLQAAMVVASAIGSLRNEDSRAPGEVLARLNRSLVGRTGGGFVTCCCALLTREGKLTVANAGHLAPYCDGREVAVDGGLPLGVVAGVVYEESIITGGCFTFVSDGVVEAANARGELFGFERTIALSGKDAGMLAEAAAGWGQNDDITAVTVRRAA